MGQSQHGKSPASEVRQIQVLPSMCRNFEARPQALGASVSSTLKWNDNHVVLLRSLNGLLLLKVPIPMPGRKKAGITEWCP